MPELGAKHDCFSCGAKFYDLGKADALCPKCGANQKDAKRQDPAAEAASARKRKKEEVVRPVVPEPKDEEAVIPEGEDFSADDDEDLATDDDAEEDFDDDDE